MKNEMTILVDSFDGYSDIWSPFFYIFKSNWRDCPFPVKLVSNHKKFDGQDVINTGDEVCWSERTLAAVKTIESKYIMLLLEDYLIGDYVDTEEIYKALSFLQKNSGKYLRLTNIPKSRFNDNDEKIFKLYGDEEYAVNLQASIWDKDFLIESLKLYAGSAWDFEIGFLSNSVKSKHTPIDGCYGMKKDPLFIKNGVLKGKWFPSTIKYFKKRGIDISWEDRGKLSVLKSVKYNTMVWLKNRISYGMRKKIKGVLKRIGMKFASDL